MTYAICIKCGEEKFGAFVPCRKCGFMPESTADQARSIVLSDHNADRQTLDAAAEKLRAGEPLEYDEPGIARMAAEMKGFSENSPSGLRGCSATIWILIGTAIVLLALLLGLVWYIRRQPTSITGSPL